MRLRRIAAFAALALVVLALDQGSKAWARTLPPGVVRPVIAGYFDWHYVRNPGAAFSTFVAGAAARVALSALAVIAIAAIARVAWRSRPDQRLERAGLALVAGGALGNLLDRVRLGAVTDFVSWHVGAHSWPTFNAADGALVVGAAILIIASARGRRKIEA